mgnify:CR=1 FL=1
MDSGFPKEISKFKLIVSDFDGTLAGADLIVTPIVVDAVKRWMDSGRLFTIATGRQFGMIEEECKKLGLTSPVIVRGGAEIIDPVTGKYLSQDLIEKDIVDETVRFLQDNKFDFLVSIDNFMYSTFNYPFEFANVIQQPYREFTIQSVPKIAVRAMNIDMEQANKLLDKFETSHSNLNIHRTHNHITGYGWDITSVRASKLHGVSKLIEILDVKREGIVGVGDGYNDFPLLEAANLKVVMQNGHDEVKAIADIIVPSYENDGVAYLIDRLLQES